MIYAAEKNDSRISPKHQKIDKGDTKTVFSCESSKFIQWFFNKNKVPSNAYSIMKSATTFVLVIKHADLCNYGSYQCFGWDAKGKEYFIAEANMKVYGNYAA